VGQSVRARKRDEVSFSPIFFIRFFELPSPKNARKRDKKKSRKKKSIFWIRIFGRIFCKNFSTRCFFQNVYFGVFELPSLRNTRRCDKTKEVFVGFCWEKFSTWTFCKNIFVVPRNAQSRTLKKNQEKKIGWRVGRSGI
jgi:hypothetical protein